MKQHRALESSGLLGIIWPFIAVVLFQALLGCVSLYTLSALRSYVAGESLWSKGQKDAIYYLTEYAERSDEASFARYREAIAIPLAGHDVRLALQRTPPDPQAARDGLLRGGNHPDDVDGILWFFRYFARVPFMASALERWGVP